MKTAPEYRFIPMPPTKENHGRLWLRFTGRLPVTCNRRLNCLRKATCREDIFQIPHFTWPDEYGQVLHSKRNNGKQPQRWRHCDGRTILLCHLKSSVWVSIITPSKTGCEGWR